MYTEYSTGQGVRNNAVQTIASTDVLNSMGVTALVAGANTSTWGLGITQAVDAAAMNLYVGYFNFSTDVTLLSQSATATIQRAKSNPLEDFSVFYSGATIRF